ncbi:kinase A anchor protein [Rhexocercosporidium sp. MPI-PUGE-AT-0058]|nr:kinase A anchor protein [Rhexocercosporidium sp. MPI-PUGE-AT-0058]
MPPKTPTARLTHFLAIPLVTPTSRPQLHQALSVFKEKATQPNTASLSDGIPEQAIRPLGTLHLTLGVMSLSTPERVQGVLDLLNPLDLGEILAGVKGANIRLEGATSDESAGSDPNPEVNGTSSKSQEEQPSPLPIHITLQGLQSMHDTSKTSVLYASPLDPDLRLYRFCMKLREVFQEFLVAENRPLLLHATIVNTVYVKGRVGGARGRGRGGRGGRGKESLVFDARELLEEWEDYVWMRGVRVERVAVLRMGAKVGLSGEEEYEIEGEVDMPA